MKINKVFLLVLIVSSFSNNTFSQTTEVNTPEERAAMLTEKMVSNLSLNETQIDQVTQINLGVAQKNDAINNDANMNQELKLASIQGNNDTRKAYFKLILTEEQYNKYLEMEETTIEVKKVNKNIKPEKESLKQEKED
jgi:hypothetical protein